MEKMSWMIDGMNSGNYVYRIQKCLKHKGTICMPTGDGKSGVMIEDIIFNILNCKEDMIINLSSPILKLNQQLLKDLFDVMRLLKINTENVRFFINSSDDGKNYSGLDRLEIDADNLSDFDKKHSKINIVASCHKSLYKFVNFIEKLEGNYNISNYLDEAHLLPLTKESNNGEDEDFIEENVRVDLDKLCKYSTSVYAFSATPDETVTNTILPYEPTPRTGKTPYAIHVMARESIQEGRILPPLVNFLRSKEDELTVENLVWIMNNAKSLNSEISHKILVNCLSRPQIKELSDGLEALGYKTFSICSPDGGFEDFEHTNIEEFSNEVENYNGDCFVFHVKMLIAGIDIKGLTDCVIFSRDHGKQQMYRKVIQTIGRTLRCLPGERGKQFVGASNKKYMDSPRKKKYGGVYFITPLSCDADGERAVRGLIERYYGLECVVFERARTMDGGTANPTDDIQLPFDNEAFNALVGNNSNGETNSTTIENAYQDPELYQLMMNIKSTLKERYSKLLKISKAGNKTTYVAIKRECDNGIIQIPGNYNTVEWLTDTSITDFVYDKIPSLFEDIGFNTDLWKSLIV